MKTLNPHYPRHIILADDDLDDRLLLAEALQEKDGTLILTQAEDGKQLMDILYLPPSPMPDLIFLDLNMPVKNGFECLEEIRGPKSNLRQLSILVFSTSGDPHNIQKAFRLGATFYAIKPHSYATLRALAADALRIIPTAGSPVDSQYILCASNAGKSGPGLDVKSIA